MCNSYISNTELSSFLVKLLLNRNIRYACISPGSRNTPMTNALINTEQIKCISHIDERASAYFGLGIAKTIGEPVVILTTSGTATANLFPAIIEASLNQIPLIVITADRPLNLINSGASQTINQNNLYGNYARDMIDINPVLDTIENQLKKLENIIDHSMGIKKNQIPGPIHINIRFDEPLIDKNKNTITFNLSHRNYEKDITTISLPQSKKPLIVCGPLDPNIDVNPIIELSKKINAPILADVLSQLRFNKQSSNIYTNYDFYINQLTKKPDLIIRFGNKPISKNLNEFLDSHMEITHLIGENANFNDDCKNIICTKIENLSTMNVENMDNDFLNYVNNLELQIADNIKREIQNHICEGQLIHNTLNQLNDNDYVFVGSSTILRSFDQFSGISDINIKFLSNHISRGIDGIVSTALGMSYVNNTVHNVLYIGDISLFYDINGFHILKDENINLTIITINNHGGQIFSRLPYSNKNIKGFKKFWITPLKTSIKNLCKLFDLKYFNYSVSEVKENFKQIISLDGIKLIEVIIENEQDINFLKKLDI